MWLLRHKEGLVDELLSIHNTSYHFLPDSLYEIYLENYKKRALNLIKDKAQNEFQLDPYQTTSILTEEFVVKYVGDVLSPKQKEG